METGIPELQILPVDPIHIKSIDFNIFNLTSEFNDMNMRGLKDFKLEKSEVIKDER